MDNSALQPPGCMCQTQLVSQLSSIYCSHSAKGSSWDFNTDRVYQSSVVVEYHNIFKYINWLSERIYRLALCFHLLQIYNHFPRKKKNLSVAPLGLWLAFCANNDPQRKGPQTSVNDSHVSCYKEQHLQSDALSSRLVGLALMACTAHGTTQEVFFPKQFNCYQIKFHLDLQVI